MHSLQTAAGKRLIWIQIAPPLILLARVVVTGSAVAKTDSVQAAPLTAKLDVNLISAGVLLQHVESRQQETLIRMHAILLSVAHPKAFVAQMLNVSRNQM